jgi:hypothetical protein
LGGLLQEVAANRVDNRTGAAAKQIVCRFEVTRHKDSRHERQRNDELDPIK